MTEVLMTVVLLLDKDTKYYTRKVSSYVVCKRKGARIIRNSKVEKGLIICEPKKDRTNAE